MLSEKCDAQMRCSHRRPVSALPPSGGGGEQIAPRPGGLANASSALEQRAFYPGDDELEFRTTGAARSYGCSYRAPAGGRMVVFVPAHLL